jgi:acyl carrier protein
MEDLERELKLFIVESLMLEDVKAEDIASDAPLFVEGLGLDSIDALELGMALTREYGIKIKADDDRNREIFRSVSSLAAFIKGHRKKESSPS